MLALEMHGERIVPVRAVSCITSGFFDVAEILVLMRCPGEVIGPNLVVPAAYHRVPIKGAVMVRPNHIDLLMQGLPQGPTRPSSLPCLDPRIRMLPAGVYYRYDELKLFLDDSLYAAWLKYHDPRLEPGGQFQWDEYAPLPEAVRADIFEGFDTDAGHSKLTELSGTPQPPISHNEANLALMRQAGETVRRWFLEQDVALDLGAFRMVQDVMDQLLRKAAPELQNMKVWQFRKLRRDAGITGKGGSKDTSHPERTLAERLLKG